MLAGFVDALAKLPMETAVAVVAAYAISAVLASVLANQAMWYIVALFRGWPQVPPVCRQCGEEMNEAKS